MSDRSLTLLAIHLEDARVQIGPKRIDRSSGADSAAVSTEEPADESTHEHAGSPLRGVVASLLVGLLVVALLLRVRAGGTGNLETESEPRGGRDSDD